MTASRLIAVVDDDESIRDSLRALLRSIGYRVAIFESSEQFLNSGVLPEIGCLILDLWMPGMNGLELQKRLNASADRVPIIFFTAHFSRANRQLAIEGGASDFLEKPVSAAVFMQAIETALKQRGPHFKIQ